MLALPQSVSSCWNWTTDVATCSLSLGFLCFTDKIPEIARNIFRDPFQQTLEAGPNSEGQST